MRIIDNVTRKAILTESYDYFPKITITLVSGETLELTESEIMVNGISKENAASSDNSFSALGSTIISGLDITINNVDSSYSQYNFEGANVKFVISVPDRDSDPLVYSTTELGKYIVDTVTETDYTIQLSLLDYMVKFDRPYSESTLSYPATLFEIVNDACTKCGVSFVTPNFRNRNLIIDTRPDDENLTFRDVIGWVASMGAYYAKMTDSYGDLEFAWFDISNFKSMGFWLDDRYVLNRDNKRTVTYDGITYQYGNGYHYIDSLYSKDINVNRISITGVKVVYVDGDNVEQSYVVGSDEYAIELKNNRFITVSNAAQVASTIADYSVGLTFYSARVGHSSNFMIQPGDAAVIYDRRKNQYYPILVTRTTFSFGSSQETVCGAESVTKNQAVRYSEISKAYGRAKELVNVEKTIRELAIEALTERIESSEGLYTTIDSTQSGGSIFYLHDKPTLEESAVIWKMTRDAWAVSTDGGTTWNAGLTVDGAFITQIMSTIGLNFEWGTGGLLTLGGSDNVNGRLRMLDASGTQVGEWKNTGLTAKSLTADDYVYVDGGPNSVLKIPIGEYNTSHYLRISALGFDVYHVATGIATGGGATDTHIRFGGIKNAATAQYYEPIFVELLGFSDTINTGVSGDGVRVTSDGSSGKAESLLTAGSLRVGTGTSTSTYTEVGPDSIELKTSNGKVTTPYLDVSKTIDLKSTGNITKGNSISCKSLSVSGSKSRVVTTEDYGNRLLYCYETPSPIFGDVGEGIVNDDGICYILIDPTFRETINTSQYQVFLQAYGEGNVYVDERKGDYFVVKGTIGLKFGWEIKAKQYDFTQLRIETDFDLPELESDEYGTLAEAHLEDIRQERGGISR